MASLTISQTLSFYDLLFGCVGVLCIVFLTICIKCFYKYFFLQCTNIENKHLAATWSENGHVYIWDLNKPLEAVDDMQKLSTYVRVGDSPSPIFKFRGHQTEGFAIDWSPITPGKETVSFVSLRFSLSCFIKISFMSLKFSLSPLLSY